MKIVIIAYLIHPFNGPRTFRANELAKEFGKRGHDVTLYGILGKYDYREFENTHHVKVKHLGRHLFSKFTSDSGASESDYWLTRAVREVVGRWFYFPHIDLARLANRVLKKEKNIDLLITVAWPFPIHWGAAWHRTFRPRNLKNTVWVADCGDPFMLNPLDNHPFYFEYVEKWFCRKADYLSIPIEEAKQAYYPEFEDKLQVIPQGFDFSESSVTSEFQKNEVPTFIYAGVFYAKTREPKPLLDYLNAKHTDFRFIVYTKTPKLLEPYRDVMKEKLVVREYIPREALIEEMSKADFLLNLENNTNQQLPSKLIDYALAKRPILSINTNEDLDTVKIDAFLEGDYSEAMAVPDLSVYDIKNVANQFLNLYH